MPRIIGSLAVIGTIGMLFCQWLIYFYAPVEATMGIVQKIFYLHLPLALWSFVNFFCVFIGSIGFLITKNESWDHLAAAAAEIGVLFSGLVLITGSIWGKQSWGVWWTWDPRLTTTLIMWFVYASYLILRTLDMSELRKLKICAVLGIVAFIDVPLVFLSARLWRSIHPTVFATKGGGIDEAMQLTVIICVIAFGFISTSLLLLRKQQLDMQSKIDSMLIYG